MSPFRPADHCVFPLLLNKDNSSSTVCSLNRTFVVATIIVLFILGHTLQY